MKPWIPILWAKAETNQEGWFVLSLVFSCDGEKVQLEYGYDGSQFQFFAPRKGSGMSEGVKAVRAEQVAHVSERLARTHPKAIEKAAIFLREMWTEEGD